MAKNKNNKTAQSAKSSEKTACNTTVKTAEKAQNTK